MEDKISCPKCGKQRGVCKNGHTEAGVQKYLCIPCNRHPFVETFYEKEQKRADALKKPIKKRGRPRQPTDKRCPKCENTLIRDGQRPAKYCNEQYGENNQKYHCKLCGERFSEHKKYNPDDVIRIWLASGRPRRVYKISKQYHITDRTVRKHINKFLDEENGKKNKILI